jgi:hypothetical protein
MPRKTKNIFIFVFNDEKEDERESLNENYSLIRGVK